MMLDVGHGTVSDAHDDINIQGVLCFGGIFAQLLLALDEVSADLLAFFVALNHRQFFGCVQGEVVVLLPSSMTYFPFLGNSYVVLIFNELILGDSFCDPKCKLMGH